MYKKHLDFYELYTAALMNTLLVRVRHQQKYECVRRHPTILFSGHWKSILKSTAYFLKKLCGRARCRDKRIIRIKDFLPAVQTNVACAVCSGSSDTMLTTFSLRSLSHTCINILAVPLLCRQSQRTHHQSQRERSGIQTVSYIFFHAIVLWSPR